MSLRRELDQKIERLLEVVDSLADSLEHEAPTDFSREYFSDRAPELRAAAGRLRDGFEAGSSRDALRGEARELKEVLSSIGSATARGEIPIARPEWLDEAMDLVYVFQEARYAGL